MKNFSSSLVDVMENKPSTYNYNALPLDVFDKLFGIHYEIRNITSSGLG